MYLYYLNNPAEAKFIINNANQFVKDYLTYDRHIFYLRKLIDFCKENIS